VTWFLSSLDIPDAALPEALEACSLKTNYNMHLLRYKPVSPYAKLYYDNLNIGPNGCAELPV
jgi:hypothetical protein